jgi:Concanavalin A-like lectin/glucanases superfamily
MISRVANIDRAPRICLSCTLCLVRIVLACLACTVGCGFHSSGAATDASGGRDGNPLPDTPVVPDAAIPPDAAIVDGPPDTPPPPPTRTRDHLIGLWEFNETDGATGATIADTSTSDATLKVPLTITSGTVTFSAGTMMPNGVTVIASGPHPHLNSDVKMALAVTLEAWVMASAADQGSVAAPVVIAGLSSSIKARNISLLQAGKRWVARVRTTSDANGLPDLTSSTDLTPGVMTHLVVVADATHRILYVNGTPDTVDPAPGPPLGWDKAYAMVLGDETSRNRQWAGTFALVAMYNQALTDQLVENNYLAGPDGH